ncbi:MAG TPA: ribosomal protein S18-alanine N-acetyltransferase [Allosphingosinicella sp.]|jgi:ribosomal-protein-alanine N-acetyltransferase|nr:ribosomal protein S18-alanine N-acetyltransferase [Allosphingosinicella sp.]
MTQPLVLSEGGVADLPAVMTVMESAFEPRFGEAWTLSQCAGLLPLPGVWLTVARGDGEVLGFSLSRIVADEAELLLLAVKPQVQRSGVGKSLLSQFERSATGRGARRLHLEVRDGNHAVNLYQSSGFTLAGRRRRYYNGGDGQLYDALSLSRPVTIPQDQ